MTEPEAGFLSFRFAGAEFPSRAIANPAEVSTAPNHASGKITQIPKIEAHDEFGQADENIVLSAQQIVFGQADEKVRYRARVFERMYRSRMMRRHKHGK